MFKHTAPNRVENEQGVVVTTTGRNTLEYREGDHLLKMFREGGFDRDDNHISGIVIEFPVQWQPPYHEEPITDEHVERIKQNLIEAKQVDGSKVVFEYLGKNVV